MGYTEDQLSNLFSVPTHNPESDFMPLFGFVDLNSIAPPSVLDVMSEDESRALEELLSTQIQQCEAGFLCILCTKTIRHASNVRRHLREAHLRQRYYRCPQCDKSYMLRSFKTHIEKSHPGWKGVDCERFRID